MHQHQHHENGPSTPEKFQLCGNPRSSRLGFGRRRMEMMKGSRPRRHLKTEDIATLRARVDRMIATRRVTFWMFLHGTRRLSDNKHVPNSRQSKFLTWAVNWTSFSKLWINYQVPLSDWLGLQNLWKIMVFEVHIYVYMYIYIYIT